MAVISHPIAGLNAKQAVRISSFEKKPLRGQMPAMARQATRNVACVTGIYLRRPPMADISLEWTAWMIHPAPRNNRALNMACVNPSPPACGSAEVLTPSATIIKPICEMVLNASTRLISLWTQATTAAYSAVKAPM